MDFSIYLAFTGAEWAAMEGFGGKAAWLGCRFSPWGSGISGVPASLPPGSMLILTDESPAQGHDPAQVAKELSKAAKELGAERVLLDFQREESEQNREIARAILAAAPCPVGITEQYAPGLDCPVLVTPPPLWMPLAEKLKDWAGREIWLEAVTESAVVTVTEEGSRYEACTFDLPAESQVRDRLQLRYRMRRLNDCIQFDLWRDREMLTAYLEQGAKLGATAAVGLYQQLKGGPFFP